MEGFLGADLSDVRVHADAPAAQAAASEGAEAFTIGRDIYFGEGTFDPGSVQGKALLGHELTHVLQQRARGPRRQGLTPGSVEALESEAQTVARRFETTAAEVKGGTGFLVNRYLSTYSVNRPATDEETQRLEALSRRALKVCEEILRSRYPDLLEGAARTLDTLEVDIDTSLAGHTDDEITQAWGHRMAAAIATRLSSQSTPTLAAAAGAVLKAPDKGKGQQPATTNITVTTQTFDIEADDLTGAAAALQSLDEWGKTRWNVTYDYDATDGVATSVAVTARITVELPRWTTLSKQPRRVQAEWNRMLTALRRHENEHVRIARERIQQLAGEMSGKPESDLPDIHARCLQDLDTLSNAFDQRTDHGEKEGVTLDLKVAAQPRLLASAGASEAAETEARAVEQAMLNPAATAAHRTTDRAQLSGEAPIVPDSLTRLPEEQMAASPDADASAAPAAAAPAPSGNSSDPSSGGLSIRGFLTGAQKVRLNAGSHQIYRAYAGKDFSWSTDQARAKAGDPLKRLPLAKEAIPVPPPVGPILIELDGTASVYAGGHAVIDVKLNNVILELTAADVAKLGGAATLLILSGGAGLLPALAVLQGVNIQGRASLQAQAIAEVSAGANLALELAANSIWPVKGFVNAGLGIAGSIGVEAGFSANDVPIVLDFLGPIPRLRLLNYTTQSEAILKAHLGLSGHLAIGVELGYGAASVRRELLRASYQPRLDLAIGHAIKGGTPATLSTSADGTPEIDLPAIYFALNDLVSALLDGTPRNDNALPQAPSGKVPVGSDADPVLIYWCKPERIYKNPILLDDADANENTPYYRDSRKLLDRAANITIGVPYWPQPGDRFTKRRGSKRAEQQRFIKFLEDHNFDFAKSDFWKFSPDHVLDIALAGNEADRMDNLWPAERTANELAGHWHANQGVWFQPQGQPERRTPTPLWAVPDGTVLRIRAIVSPPPPEPPPPDVPGS